MQSINGSNLLKKCTGNDLSGSLVREEGGDGANQVSSSRDSGGHCVDDISSSVSGLLDTILDTAP